MKLDDAELQQTTGSLIGKGSLKIGTEADTAALGIAAHGHVLLSSQEDVVTLWPVTDFTRDKNGFCEAVLDEVGLAFWSLSLDDIGKLAVPGAGRNARMKGGSQTGDLLRRVQFGDKWINKQQASPIQNYELGAEYGPDGLYVSISGQVALDQLKDVKPLSLHLTIPWATLTLKGIEASGAYWKFGHSQGGASQLESTDRPRNSRALNDLLISEGLTWPYLKGKISFTPEPLWLPSSQYSAHDFVSIHFQNNQIGFWDARNLKVLDTGFARSDALNRHINVTMFDRRRLEAALFQRDSFSIQLAGNLVGSVRYLTGYADPRDSLGRLEQPIKTMSLQVALGKDGLVISAHGELDDFDPVEFAKHKVELNSEPKPIRAYAVQAVMPWALLITRGFSFASRAQDF